MVMSRAEMSSDGGERGTTAKWVEKHRALYDQATRHPFICSIKVGSLPSGDGFISKAKLNEYSEKIEALAARLSVPEPEPVEIVEEASMEEIVPVLENTERRIYPTQMLRKGNVSATKVDDRNHETTERDSVISVKLDAEAYARIEKHRKFHDGLTDEMVTLAEQLKESSLMMNRSLRETEKILDSTEKAVEHSLASTGRVNTRAVEIYSQSSKTSCLAWLVMFAMLCIFVMVVLLIRIT